MHVHGNSVAPCYRPDQLSWHKLDESHVSITSVAAAVCAQKEITTPAPMQARYKAVMQERQEADGVEAMDI